MFYRSAVSNLYTQSMSSRTDFFVLDQFTLARWPTLDIMLYSPISVEDYIILDGTVLGNLASVNFTGTVSTLKLVAQIKSGGGIPFVRVFEFTKSRFVRLWHTTNLGVGWSASNGGYMDNSSGANQLVIGFGTNYTYILEQNHMTSESR